MNKRSTLKAGQRVRMRELDSTASYLWGAVGTVIDSSHEHKEGCKLVRFDEPAPIVPGFNSRFEHCWVHDETVERI